MRLLEKLFIGLIVGGVFYFVWSFSGWSSKFDKNLGIGFGIMWGVIAFIAWRQKE